MQNLKRKDESVSVVPQAVLPPDSSFEKMSQLGRDLWQISSEINKSGEPELLTQEEIEQEIARRRGGYVTHNS